MMSGTALNLDGVFCLFLSFFIMGGGGVLSQWHAAKVQASIHLSAVLSETSVCTNKV